MRARERAIGMSRPIVASLLTVIALGTLSCAGRAPASSPEPRAARVEAADWPTVHGAPEGTRHSPLTQFTPENVSSLQPAWTYHTGDADPAAFSTIECTPLVIDGVMYVTSARNKVIALAAATGEELWRFDPFIGRPWRGLAADGVNRGVAYWSDGRPDGERAILHGTPDGRLIALDPRTGLPKPAFGDNGVLDLKAGLDAEVRTRGYGMTSPPAVFEDFVIIGVSVGEGPEPAAPGDIRAFDARTGRERWTFHTVPRPGEPAHETWAGDSWKHRGGVNAWSGLTVDPRRGLVFAGLGSATFDFYGGDRHGDNLYANATVALDARTGRRVWHFQTVRHDLWDYDLPTPPVLVTVTHGGRAIDAAAQVTKTGVVFLFDRATGKPLFDVVDRPAPASTMPDEQPAAAQPMPVKPPPFARHQFSLEDVHGTDEEATADARARFTRMQGGRIFSPPSLQGTLSFPGFRGGATWSGASFDPARGWLFVNSNEIANVITLAPNESIGSRYRLLRYEQFLDKHGYPAVKPPWGTLSAIDLNAGRIVWQVPLGEHPELAARGLRRTGTENFGGTIVTASGIVFIGGSKDEKFHAFDAGTGRLLWETPLPAGGYATPATYAVNGRQFVVIAAGGGGKPRTKSGDAFVAFALATTATPAPTPQAARKDKPNVILIHADDLGWGDLSVYGQQRFQTPRLDRLASEGIRFTQYYSGSTVCAPSRAALMTGLHTGHNLIRGNGDFPLRDEDITIAEVLRPAGYRTATIGKWGLGDAGTSGQPERQGFDEAFGYLRHPHAHRQFTDRLWKNGQWVDVSPERDYAPDLFTQAALDFIDRSKDGPFFLYLAYPVPHAELRAPDGAIAPYRGIFPETPFSNAKADAATPVPPYSQSGGYRSQPHPRAAFAGMVSRMDSDVGLLVDRLRALGLDRNTVVLFTSDNGPHREGGADPEFFDSNGPLRGIKRDLYEGGIRVPMIAWGPGIVPAGILRDTIWAHWDLLPTLAELAGMATPAGLDGRPQSAALTGSSSPAPVDRSLYWEFHERGFQQAGRQGRWKAVRLELGQPIELFDLDRDVSEATNVAASHPTSCRRSNASSRAPARNRRAGRSRGTEPEQASCQRWRRISGLP